MAFERGSMVRYREPWCERCGERPQTDSLVVCGECARETAGVPSGDVEPNDVLRWRADPDVCAVCGVAWDEHERIPEYMPVVPAGVAFDNVAQAREFVERVMGVGRVLTVSAVESFVSDLLTDRALREYEERVAA